jgi:hypothetical protein
VTDTTYTVDTDGAGDYSSLSAAESALQGTIGAGDRIILDCTGATADSTGTTVAGWTINSTGRLVIRAKPDDTTNGLYTGNAGWSTSHYRLDVNASNFRALRLQDPYCTVEDIQLSTAKNSSSCYGLHIEDGSILIDGIRVRNSSGGGCVYTDETTSVVKNVDIINCRLMESPVGAKLGNIATSAPTDVRFVNNTILDCTTGVTVVTGGTPDAATVWEIHNNAVINATTDMSNLNAATVTVNATYNGGEGSAPTGHDSNWTTISTGLTDDTTTGGYDDVDFTPATSSDMTDAGSSGVDGYDATDALGNTRDSSPDLGCIEVIAAAASTGYGLIESLKLQRVRLA